MIRSILLVAVGGLWLTGCTGFFGSTEDPPLPGERLAVLGADHKPVVDPAVAARPMDLPQPVANADWPQTGGGPAHGIQHPALGGALELAWSADIGAGSSGDRILLAPPVVGDGTVFAIDTDGSVSAHALADGSRLWTADVRKKDERDGFGGGLAWEPGGLYAATGFAEALRLDPGNGGILWRRPLSAPTRAAPNLTDGRVHVVTLDNRTHALDGGDGAQIWVHNSVSEATALVGTASPAAAEGIVVAAYSSGEIVALKRENGRMLWSDRLAGFNRPTLADALADIPAPPVAHRGRLYVIGNAGRAAAIDMRTGARVWDLSSGGRRMPWLAGDNFFVVTDRAEAVAADAVTGRVRWVVQLRAHEDEEDREGRIDWVGPVLAGGRIVLANSLGEVVFLAPGTGEVTGTLEAERSFRLPPVVAGGTLLLLADDGTLLAYR